MKLSIRVRQHPIAALVSWLLLTFLVLFPKGGFKLGDTPLTWGYLLLGLTAPPLLVVRLLALPLKFSPKTLIAIGILVPFQILFLYSYLQNGIEDAGYATSIFVSFFVLPILFLLIYPPFLGRIGGKQFTRYFRICILAAAIYGIFLFFWHPITGNYIEIPYLTVNAGDYGLLATTKHIDRGLFFKLISTYNNGNVYGAATLILLPLYDLLEPKLWKRNVLKVALFLTLSRTVWAGLVFEQMLSFFWWLGSIAPTFPKFYLGITKKQGFLLLVAIGIITVGLGFNSAILGFIFDPTLGGRAGESLAFLHPTFLPELPVGGFAEMLYSSAITSYGVTGFVSICLIFFSPILLFALDPEALVSLPRRAALKGLILYAMIATIDGATNLIPVMAFYWFAYMTFLFGLPGNVSWDSSQNLDGPRPSWQPHDRRSLNFRIS